MSNIKEEIYEIALTELQMECDELKAHIDRLRNGLEDARIFSELVEIWGRTDCEIYKHELKSSADLSLSRILPLLDETPSQSLSHIRAQVEEETVGKYAKDIATEFFFYWYNSPGTNTEQGFDEWWEINRDRLTPRKYKEQSDETGKL